MLHDIPPSIPLEFYSEIPANIHQEFPVGNFPDISTEKSPDEFSTNYSADFSSEGPLRIRSRISPRISRGALPHIPPGIPLAFYLR